MGSPPLNGLLLAGGHSRRMHCDKAMLLYRGKTQLQRAAALATSFCEETFLSLRRGQKLSPKATSLPVIEDTFGEIGPMGGILSAFGKRPGEAWLVVACDLPFLDKETLQLLLKERDPQRIATAFRSAHDGLPEPLCAIYEPNGVPQMQQLLAEKQIRCPRKILMQTKPKLLDLVQPNALDNINTPEEYESAVSQLESLTEKRQTPQ